MAIGQCKNGNITVATVAPAHGADNVVADKEDSGRPPLPHRGYPMSAYKKHYNCPWTLNVDVKKLLMSFVVF